MAYQHYRTWGIFLAQENRGEADQLFFIFTLDFGMIEVLAKSVRKLTSKLRSGVTFFYLSEIEFIQGKHYKILTDALPLEKFENIRQDTAKVKIARGLGAVTKFFLIRSERDLKIWALLKDSFNYLNSQPGELIQPYFFWNFLGLLGYLPELYRCPLCQKKVKPEIFYLIPKEGGLVCGHCASGLEIDRNEREFIKVNTVKLIRMFLQKPLEVLTRLKVDQPDLENLVKVSSFMLGSFQEFKNAI
ncbi:MAG: DNA repair protein RecO [Candidatus Gribaldobacteria bacterium]|nr:DNA repair protein RecO [Candidatus Gribaldobacteria bacterium]